MNYSAYQGVVHSESLNIEGISRAGISAYVQRTKECFSILLHPVLPTHGNQWYFSFVQEKQLLSELHISFYLEIDTLVVNFNKESSFQSFEIKYGRILIE